MTPRQILTSSSWVPVSSSRWVWVGVELGLNSLGSPGDLGSRQAYEQALSDYLNKNRSRLSAQTLVTLERNPLRVLDSKREQDSSVITQAPVMVDFLDDDSAAHFAAVRAGLDAVGIAYEISPRLVRGLDYYTRTTFEFAAVGLPGAQNAVGGGGRYDGLVEDLGGPRTRQGSASLSALTGSCWPVMRREFLPSSQKRG